MSEKLAGKRAIVTGGATGIGYGIAKRFIAEGASHYHRYRRPRRHQRRPEIGR